MRPLDATTWPDFAALVERHNGVWGGCWCMAFHEEGVGTPTPSSGTAPRRSSACARAARTPRWSTTARRASAGASSGRPTSCRGSSTAAPTWQGLDALPDWRITCFFVDSAHRRRGVPSAALGGALEEIARLGGGTVESYPQDIGGGKVSASFLHNGTLSLFEHHGFERTRQIGKHHWVVSRVVP